MTFGTRDSDSLFNALSYFHFAPYGSSKNGNQIGVNEFITEKPGESKEGYLETESEIDFTHHIIWAMHQKTNSDNLNMKNYVSSDYILHVIY